MSILTFNFHNIVGVQIESNDPGALRFFEAEYRSFVAPIPEGINNVRLSWKRKRSIWPFIKGYHSKVHKLLARWSYRILLDKNRITIDALGNMTAVPMIHHMLVHPSLRYLSAQHNIMMLHGSAVVFKGRSLVFTGAGGAGKTTISSLLLDHGGKDWKLHADDYVFLTKGPSSFSYMTRSHLYRNQIRWVPSIKRVLSRWERVQLEFFGRLREITRDGVKWPLRVEPSRLWPEHSIAPQVPLGAVLLLFRGDLNKPVLKRIGISDQILDDLMQMNFHEARHFVNLIRRDFNDSDLMDWLQAWKDKERDILRQVLQESALYRLELPSGEYAKEQYGKELIDLLVPIVRGDVDRESHDRSKQ